MLKKMESNSKTSAGSPREMELGAAGLALGGTVISRGSSQGISLAFLSTLHCPYCGSALEPHIRQPAAEFVEQGILRCACHQYPVVAGIPIIQQMDGLERIVEFVERGEPTRALLQALSVFRVRWAHRSRWHQFRYHLNCRRVVSDTRLTFAQAAQLVRRPKVFADYLVHRFANPNFLAAIGPMLLLDRLRPSRRVLDVGCGAGHASFLMGALHPGLVVVSGDQDFVSLYLAKRFLAPDATQVCWSAEVPSPFPDRCFDAVFCLDAFHYMSSKQAVVAELRRIATTEALWLFPHLHNRLQPNLVAGIPLSPEHYLECFGFPDARLFDEAEILRGLTHEHVLNLEPALSIGQLNSAPTLTFVRGGQGLWRKHDGFPSALCRNRAQLAINPIYQQRRSADGLELERVWPNDTLRNECRGAEAVLPARCRLNRGDLSLLNAARLLREMNPEGRACAMPPSGTSQGSPREITVPLHTSPLPTSSISRDEPAVNRLHELVSRFVLVPLPARYAAGQAP